MPIDEERKAQQAQSVAYSGGGTDYQAQEDRPRVCPECDGTKLRELHPEDDPSFVGLVTTLGSGPVVDYGPRVVPCEECDEDGLVG